MKEMKRLMKKVVASIAVTSMLLTMGAMTVLASPETPEVPTPPTPIPPTGGGTGSVENPEKPDLGGISGGTITIDGKVYNLLIEEMGAEAKAATDTIDKIIALMGNKYVNGSTIKVLGRADAKLPPALDKISAGGTVLPFNVAGVKKGDIVKILHQKHDKSWEVLDTTTGEGTVSAVFTELSPVLFVEVIEPKSGNNVDPNKSPRTGR